MYLDGDQDDQYQLDKTCYEFELEEKEKFDLDIAEYNQNNPDLKDIEIDEGYCIINGEKCKLIEQKRWENIHIGYETILHNQDVNIYRRPINTRREHIYVDCKTGKRVHVRDVFDDGRFQKYHVPSAISHALYLRILYEILTDDEDLDGADFIVDEMLSSSSHPLCQFFALHQKEFKGMVESEFSRFKCVACTWHSKGSNTTFLDAVRNYYGEQISFYFAFLIHYTVWLYPLAVLGTIWWIIEYVILDIGSAGGVIVVIVIITWTTLMIENWYRREWRLRFRWGMMRYRHTETPRATFHGKYVISTVNGMRIETYDNYCLYWFKRIISISISFICILIVISVTAFLWGFKGEYNDKTEGRNIGLVLLLV